MRLAQIIFRNVGTPLFLNSFIQDFIANFRITCRVRMHPNADTFKYIFYRKVNVNEFATLWYLHISIKSLILRVIVFWKLTIHSVHPVVFCIEVVRCGAVRYVTVSYGKVRESKVRYGTVQYGTVRYGMGRYGTVRYGSVRYSTVRYGTVKYGTVRYGSLLH